jgi:hypothetical protein
MCPSKILIQSLIEEEKPDLSLSLGVSTFQKSPHKTEGSHLHARKRALTRNQTGQNIDLGLQPPELLEKKCLWFKPVSLWHFVMAAQAD